MFGFGKKKLDDSKLGNITIEVQMFQSWTLDNRRCDLTRDELKMIITAIFEREKLSYESDHVSFAVMACLSQMDYSSINKFRTQSNFDQQVAGFCRSIGLPSKYYTPA